MTESKRQSLLTACAFAKVFMEAADRELRGGDPVPREEAADELRASLRALDTYNPDINRPSTQPYTQTAADIRAIREEFDRERASWT